MRQLRIPKAPHNNAVMPKSEAQPPPAFGDNLYRQCQRYGKKSRRKNGEPTHSTVLAIESCCSTVTLTPYFLCNSKICRAKRSSSLEDCASSRFRSVDIGLRHLQGSGLERAIIMTALRPSRIGSTDVTKYLYA